MTKAIQAEKAAAREARAEAIKAEQAAALARDAAEIVRAADRAEAVRFRVAELRARRLFR